MHITTTPIYSIVRTTTLNDYNHIYFKHGVLMDIAPENMNYFYQLQLTYQCMERQNNLINDIFHLAKKEKSYQVK